MVYRRELNIQEISVEEFAKVVAMEVATKLGNGFDVKTDVIIKRNDNELHSVAVCREDTNMAPSFYVDETYRYYIVNDTINADDIVSDFASRIAECALEIFRTGKNIPDADKVISALTLDKDSLSVMLLDMKLNRAYLRNHPYKEVAAGLAMVICMNLDCEHGVTINNRLVEKYNKEALFQAALENMEKNHPAELHPLYEMIKFGNMKNALCLNEPIREPHVLTVEGTNMGATGAAAIVYEGIAEKIAELYGGSFWMLPSSLYEWIIIPDEDGTYPEGYKTMVGEINASIVDPKDVLSFDVFYYDKNEKTIKRM